MAGLDLKDCFLHCLYGSRGVYLLLLFGLGPFSGWKEKCVEEASPAAGRIRPSLRVVDTAGDRGIAEETGSRAHLFARVTRFMKLPPKLGSRLHTKPSVRWWPSDLIPCLGFEVDTKASLVQLAAEKRGKWRILCIRWARAPPATGDLVLAKEIL